MSGRDEEAAAIIREIYKLANRLEELYGDQKRKFTPDGHLVGSFGEVLAVANYHLDLFKGSHPVHDAEAESGKVQIKATQGRQIGLRAEPEHLLVLSLGRDGSFQEVYNGSGKSAWDRAGKMQSNGQRPLGIKALRELQSSQVSVRRRV